VIVPGLPESEIAVESLHSSIYYLAQSDESESAEAFLEEIRMRYGNACATEASPYWLAISPDLMDAFQEDVFQKRGAWWEYFPVDVKRGMPWDKYVRERERQIKSNQQRYESDMVYLDELIQRSPDENYVDYALFFRGRYQDIILRSDRDSLLLFDKAFYAWGLEAFAEQSYEEAVHRYQSFLNLKRFAEHDWRDDALWRIAKAYFALGNDRQALRHLTLSKNELHADGSVHEVNLYCDIAYVADIGLDEQGIQHYARMNTDPEVSLILKFTLALKHLVSGRNVEAQTLFEELAQAYPDVEMTDYFVVGEDELGPTLALFSIEKLEAIDRIEQILKTDPPESLYELADFYLFAPDVFENRLLGHLSDVKISEEEFPPDYFIAHNAFYRAAELLYSLAEDYPDLEKKRTVLFKMSEAYDRAASDRALTDSKTIEWIRQKAVDGYRQVLSGLDQDSEEFDRVFEAIGAIYLHRPDLYKDWPWVYTEADMRGLQREYTRLAEEYPNSHLGNNALNWVAWSYCCVANMYPPDSVEYEQNYREALAVYRELAQMDPLSGITQNAIEAATIIEEKLTDPDKRVPVPEERWGW
jgi:hypothetical protein